MAGGLGFLDFPGSCSPRFLEPKALIAGMPLAAEPERALCLSFSNQQRRNKERRDPILLLPESQTKNT